MFFDNHKVRQCLISLAYRSIIILCSIMFNMESKTKGTASTEIEKGKVISAFCVMTD